MEPILFYFLPSFFPVRGLLPNSKPKKEGRKSWNFSFILNTRDFPYVIGLDRYRTMLQTSKSEKKGRTLSRYIRIDEMMSEFSHGGSTNGLTHFLFNSALGLRNQLFCLRYFSSMSEASYDGVLAEGDEIRSGDGCSAGGDGGSACGDKIGAFGGFKIESFCTAASSASLSSLSTIARPSNSA